MRAVVTQKICIEMKWSSYAVAYMLSAAHLAILREANQRITNIRKL
jgi:hypothetical protein